MGILIGIAPGVLHTHNCSPRLVSDQQVVFFLMGVLHRKVTLSKASLLSPPLTQSSLYNLPNVHTLPGLYMIL